MNSKPYIYNFDAMAEDYDSWYMTRKGALFDRFEKEGVLKMLSPTASGKELLDVGCGTGHWSSFFREQGYRVTGIDISKAMINIANDNSITGSRFVIGDAHYLPFEDETFDVSVAITTLEFVRNPAGVVRELVRCTRKSGGRVVVGVLNCCARINRNRRSNRIQPYADALFLSPRQLRNMLQPYGETDIFTTSFVPGLRCLYPFSSLFNTVGNILHLPTGAFIIGSIKR